MFAGEDTCEGDSESFGVESGTPFFLLDENHAGFRKVRSLANVIQIIVRVHEDMTDCKKRVNEGEEDEDVSENEWPCTRLLDLRKAYLRVSKPPLWMLLERYVFEEEVYGDGV